MTAEKPLKATTAESAIRACSDSGYEQSEAPAKMTAGKPPPWNGDHQSTKLQVAHSVTTHHSTEEENKYE